MMLGLNIIHIRTKGAIHIKQCSTLRLLSLLHINIYKQYIEVIQSLLSSITISYIISQFDHLQNKYQSI